MSAAAIAPNPTPAANPGLLDPYLCSDGEGFSFHDLVSIVNPLQHIPVVATIYRAVTGDTIAPVERVAGDTLYGGLWGLISSVANVAFEEITGKDFGDTALALLQGDDDGKTEVASAQPSPAATPSSDTSAASPTFAPAGAMAESPIAPAAVATAWVGAAPTVAQPATAAPDTMASTMPATRATKAPSLLQPGLSSADQAASAALLSAMTSKGIDSELSRRALSAYQKSLQAAPQTSPAQASPIS